FAKSAKGWATPHPSGNYTTYGKNCTTTCAVILRKLHLYTYAPISPNEFFTTLADQYSKHSQFRWPNNVPQNGMDYGTPRIGYDAFEMLYRTIHEHVTHKFIWDGNG